MNAIPIIADPVEAAHAPAQRRLGYRTLRALSAIVLVATAGAGGFWLGRADVSLPFATTHLDGWMSAGSEPAEPSDASGPTIYYRDPEGRPVYAAGPQKTADGRDFIAVRASQDVSLDPIELQIAAAGADRRILYYRNPMGLPDTSPEPKKDWMGMDYIPVYEGEEEEGNTIKISLGKVQRAGVRSEPAAMRQLSRPVRAPGVAKPDERTLYSVSLRADGFIERLHANETGRSVLKGETLFSVYSPDMVKVQVDYRVAGTGRGAQDGALQRLRNLRVPSQVIETLQRTGEPVVSIDWPAPVSGIVMKRTAVEGMMMRAGEEMLLLSDPSSVWVIADVAEQDLAAIRLGSMAVVRFRAFPNEVFEGRAAFILSELEMATRTAKVRVELDNSDHRIKYEMFAEVEFNAGDADVSRLVVPDSALIESGNRQVVLIDLGDGRFEPRPVRVGLRGDGYVEVLEGVSVGENVVVSATFLIDAESNLKAALSNFTPESPAKAGREKSEDKETSK